MIIRIRCEFLAILVLLFPILLQAQSLELAGADFFDDAPLILTASRMSKPLNESPASVSVIDRQMIESSGARELADIFRLVPGFIVGNFNGNTPVVTYHGFGDRYLRQIQVLVDGRSVFVPTWGGVPWNNLPLLIEDIERIEVIRGPNAVTYGANSFLATINIITRHAAEDIGARYSLTTSDSTNPDVGDAYFRLGYQHESLDWRLSVGTLNDDGFAFVNDSRETNKLNYRLDYQSGNNQLWTVLLGSSNTISGKGIADNPLDIERDAEASNSYININWEQISEANSTNIRLTHTVQELVDGFWADPSSGLIVFLDNGRLSRRTDIELFQTHEHGRDLRLVYGGSLRKDRLKSLYLFNDTVFHDVDTKRLYAAIEWRPDQNWLLDFGTAVEKSTLTDLEYSPRFSILRKLGQAHTVRFVASEASRNPVLYEHSGSTIFNVTIPSIPVTLDAEYWRGNPDIEPESIISFEVGLRSQLINNQLSSDLKLFSYKVTGMVDPVTIATNALGDNIKTMINEDDARVNGLELALNFTSIHGLDVKAGFSYLEPEADKRDLKASFPDYSLFLTSGYRWNSRHSLSASYYYVDELEWLDQRESESLSATEKLDLRYAYTIDKISETRIELIGQNLLGDYYDYFPTNLNEKLYLLRITGGF